MSLASLIPSFNSGELSPLIHLRSDLEKYRSGCRTLRNFLITPFGGVRRRSGFAYFGTATSAARVFRFQASTDLGYILEFGEEYIRFYLNSIVQAAGGGEYTVASPYAAADLASLQMVQINSVAYFTHPNHPPYKLTRVYNNLWEFIPVPFSVPAMRDENPFSFYTLTTSPASNVGSSITVTSTVPLFTPSHIGSVWQISHPRQANQFEVSLPATAGYDGIFSTSLIVQGAWSFITSGTWTGTFIIQRSTDNGSNWATIRQFTSAADQNFTAGGTEDARVLLRIGWDHGATGSSSPKAMLEATGAFIRGYVKITGVTTDQQCTAEVVDFMQAGTTSYWREGAWSGYRGYPRTVCAHEGRVIYGGNLTQPSTVWGSAVDDFENFRPGGVGDSDSWTHALASDQQNSIQWMISQKSLLIGTSGDEWAMASSGQEEIITPTNVRARRHSGNGSEFLKARVINDAVLFVQRGGKKLRDLVFSFESDGYVSNDLTLLAEHVTGEGIIDTAWQAQPYGTLWCVTKNGELLGLTYDRQQNIAGWSRHTTGAEGDGFESVAVRSTNGEKDQVWVVVRRTIDGTVRRYIERMNDDGFFLEPAWTEQLAPVDGVALWAINYESYVVGDVVLGSGGGHPFSDTDAFYFCVENHTTDATYAGGGIDDHAGPWTLPLATDQTWVWAFPWLNSLTSGGYLVNDTVHWAGGDIYRCIVDHGATGGGPGIYEPGFTAGWDTYWDLMFSRIGTVQNLALQDSYLVDDEVQNDGKVYKCTVEHAPTAATEPGVGASWATKWELQQGEYLEGDLVSQTGRNYLCTADHTPTTDDQPGIGADWGDFWNLQSTDNLLFFVDSGVSKFDFVGDSLTGLDHLEGETVQVLANGSVLPSRTVTAGAIPLNLDGDPEEFTSLCVGLQYDSILEPMALEAGTQSGTSTGREKRIHEVMIYFHQSRAGKVSWRVAGPFDSLPFRTGDMIADNPTPLFTGAIRHALDMRHDLDASFVIKQDLPLPMMVTAVVPKWNIHGD